MVKTGARAGVLSGLLREVGFAPGALPPPSSPRLTMLSPEGRNEVLALYRAFGGIQSEPTLRPGGWDLWLEGSVVVELDEELHFNRYRAETLGRPWARSLPWKSDYVGQCKEYEERCLAAAKWGRRWTNPSCELLFGAAAPPGEFNDSGAPRWKQRALYDYMKDVFGLESTDPRLARLSVHDRIGEATLDEVLLGGAAPDLGALSTLVAQRLSPLA